MPNEFLLSKSRRALDRHAVAKAAGDRLAIAAARRELERVQKDLERARAEAEALASIAKALRTPLRMGW